jgi:hypothetical protein
MEPNDKEPAPAANRAPVVKNLHVEKLVEFYTAIADALIYAGLSGNQLNSIFAGHVHIECVECGFELSGNDLSVLTLTPAETRLDDPRLARLRQGYCGRKDCNSKYFTVTLSPHPELDWAGVIARVESHGSSPVSDQAESPMGGSPMIRADRTPSAFSKPHVRLVAGIAILLALLLGKYWLSNGTLPGFSPKPKYQVDPASLIQDAR